MSDLTNAIIDDKICIVRYIESFSLCFYGLSTWTLEVYEQILNMQRTGICANVLAALIALICLSVR